MNIQVITNAGEINGQMLSGGLMLEKKYEDSKYADIKRVHYFIYNLDTNEKTEINPRSEKYELFDITDCSGNSDYIYYTEYDDQYDGTFDINIVRFNYHNGDSNVIFSMTDRIENYPHKKQVKIFILNDSNLLFQRAIPRTNLKDNYDGFFDFTLLLFNFEENRKTEIIEENFVQNGIEKIIAINDTMCVVKTGYSLFEDNRYDYLEREEAAVESIGIINREQLVSDLILKNTSIVMDTIERTCYDSTIPYVLVDGNYVIYSTYENKTSDETLHFYNINTRESITCINKNVTSAKLLATPYILNDIPYVRLNNSNGIQFFNLVDNKHDIILNKEQIFNYISDDICIMSEEKHVLFSGKKNIIKIFRLQDLNNPVCQEKGDYMYTLKAGETYYIFIR